MATSRGRAVVIGASLAGLVAARVLSDYFEDVVLLDRDRLPDQPEPRPGVPQTQHPHALLATGREALEELLPGLTEDLVSRGAEVGDLGERGPFHVGGAPLARVTTGHVALAASRPLLEWYVRQRVQALPNVKIRDRTTVLDLVFDADEVRVAGVLLSQEWPGNTQSIASDLVVDASGRTARTVEWLERRGYEGPLEERVRVDVVYATRLFRRSPGDADGNVALIQPASAALPRSGILISQEDDRWIAALTGYHGVRPPTELAGFVAYAQSMPGPIGQVVETLEPLDTGLSYRFPASVRRRYERMPRFPEGLLAIGDAICAFNPAYGQGMSVAAREALSLRDCLQMGDADLARRFFAQAARHIDNPWTTVIGRDRALPGSGERVSLRQRLINRYLTALMRAAVHDPVLSGAFLRVAHLLADPASLLAPRHLVRVAAFAASALPGLNPGDVRSTRSDQAPPVAAVVAARPEGRNAAPRPARVGRTATRVRPSGDRPR